MASPRFCFVSTLERAWGGSEELWSRAALALLKQGFAVSVAVRYWPQHRPRLDALREAGAEIHQRRITARDFVDYGLAKLLRKQAQRPPGLGNLMKWLRARRPTLICFSNGGFAPPVLMMAGCTESGLRYVSVAQANGPSFWPPDESFPMVRRGLLNAERVFFVSNENRELAELQIAARLPQSEVVRNPFSVDYDAAPDWPEVTSDQDWRLASVARLEPEPKGHDLILRVLAQEKWRRRPVHMTFYGAGPFEKGLKEAVKLIGLEQRISFAGHVENVKEIWARNHALVLASRFEGLPLALVEAMLCERIPIVTAVAGNTEIVSDGLTGFLAQAATVPHLDDALERAWRRRGEWRALGHDAGTHVRTLVPRDPAREFAERLKEIAETLS